MLRFNTDERCQVCRDRLAKPGKHCIGDSRKPTQDRPIEFKLLKYPLSRVTVVDKDIRFFRTMIAEILCEYLLKALLVGVRVEHLCIFDVLAPSSLLSHVTW